MAQSTVLQAVKRPELGTRASRALREEGRIPANLQGTDLHIDFSLEEREFLASRRHHVHLYDIDIEGDVQTAVVRELMWDTFGDSIIHIEFKKVTRGVKTEADVKLEFYGHPEGGILNQLLAHITVRCIPSKIPDSIQVRVDKHAEGDHILAEELELPEGVSLAVGPETELATIVAAKRGPMLQPGEGEEGEGVEGEAPEPPTGTEPGEEG